MAVDAVADAATWAGLPTLVERYTHQILDAVDAAGVKATLFVPMSVSRVGLFKLPFSGGGYLRVLPYWMIRRGFRKLNGAGVPVVTYLHPRDFAPDCPRVPMPLHRRFKSYVGLGTTARKLARLLGEFRFDTCWNVLNTALGARA